MNSIIYIVGLVVIVPPSLVIFWLALGHWRPDRVTPALQHRSTAQGLI